MPPSRLHTGVTRAFRSRSLRLRSWQNRRVEGLATVGANGPTTPASDRPLSRASGGDTWAQQSSVAPDLVR
jgi:hypothetical protein